MRKETEYSEGLKIWVVLILGIFFGMLIFAQAYRDGSIPQQLKYPEILCEHISPSYLKCSNDFTYEQIPENRY